MKLNSSSEQYVLDALEMAQPSTCKWPCPMKAQQTSGTFMHN